MTRPPLTSKRLAATLARLIDRVGHGHMSTKIKSARVTADSLEMDWKCILSNERASKAPRDSGGLKCTKQRDREQERTEQPQLEGCARIPIVRKCPFSGFWISIRIFLISPLRRIVKVEQIAK
jgi:hypothetical protein